MRYTDETGCEFDSDQDGDFGPAPDTLELIEVDGECHLSITDSTVGLYVRLTKDEVEGLIAAMTAMLGDLK